MDVKFAITGVYFYVGRKSGLVMLAAAALIPFDREILIIGGAMSKSSSKDVERNQQKPPRQFHLLAIGG